MRMHSRPFAENRVYGKRTAIEFRKGAGAIEIVMPLRRRKAKCCAPSEWWRLTDNLNHLNPKCASPEEEVDELGHCHLLCTHPQLS